MSRGATNVITLVLPSQNKGAGRPATGSSAYVPKKKGVALARMVEEQEAGSESKAPEPTKAADKGPVTIRVEKADMDAPI
jgi:hypothetical protein